MTNDFDLDKARADLIALRAKHGANTPVGHRASNLIEQLENLGKEQSAEHRIGMQKHISRSLAELAALTQPEGERGCQ